MRQFKYKKLMLLILLILAMLTALKIKQNIITTNYKKSLIPFILPPSIWIQELKFGIREKELIKHRLHIEENTEEASDPATAYNYFEKIQNNIIFTEINYDFAIEKDALTEVKLLTEKSTRQELMLYLPSFIKEIINTYGEDYKIYLMGFPNNFDNKWRNNIPQLRTSLKWDKEFYIVEAVYPSSYIEKVTGKNVETGWIFKCYYLSISRNPATSSEKNIFKWLSHDLKDIEGTPYENYIKKEISEALSEETSTKYDDY